MRQKSGILVRPHNLPRLVEKYQWKWVPLGDLSKLLGTMFGLHLELENVHQFIVNMVKAKLEYWKTTYL